MSKTEHLVLWADGSFDRCATVAAVARAVRAYAARQARNALLGSPEAEAWLSDPGRRCRGVLVVELLQALGCERRGRSDEMRAAAMLRAAGYSRRRERVSGVRAWRWYYYGDQLAGVASDTARCRK